VKVRGSLHSLGPGMAPQDRVGLLTIPCGGLNVGLTADRAKIQSAIPELSGRAPRSESDADAACRTQQVLGVADEGRFAGRLQFSDELTAVAYLEICGVPKGALSAALRAGSSPGGACCLCGGFPDSGSIPTRHQLT
jgi:hypothetical protein